MLVFEDDQIGKALEEERKSDLSNDRRQDLSGNKAAGRHLASEGVVGPRVRHEDSQRDDGEQVDVQKLLVSEHCADDIETHHRYELDHRIKRHVLEALEARGQCTAPFF